jgi:hypothetical protein
MGDWHQIELDVQAAFECAETATLRTNDLVGRTLESAVSGKEAATTLHHAYSAQVLSASGGGRLSLIRVTRR